MRTIGAAAAIMMVTWCAASTVLAVEKPLEELPQDVGHLTFFWTEPIKSVAEQTRRFDPVSGLWFGLLEGTVKSLERTTHFLFFEDDPPSRVPREPGKRFRYTF